MKKLLALILALCLCFSTGACADTDAPATTTGDTTATLTVWAIENSSITDYATNGQSKWMEQQTNTQITWSAVPAQGWYNAFQASVMGEEKVDIYLYPFDTMEAEMLGIDMQIIIPLDELITPENAPNISAILEADPALKDLITASDGHIYTLFANDVYNTEAYKQKLWVNRYFLEKYTVETGNSLPQTTAEFENMLLYFKNNDMNGDGHLNEIPFCGMSGVDGMYNLFGAFLPANSGEGFGSYLDENGQLQFSYNQDVFKDALAYVQSLYQQGLISQDTFTINEDERYTYTSGSKDKVRTGVVTGVSADQVVQLSAEENAMTYEDYVALPPLEGPQGVRTIVSTGEQSVGLRNAITKYCQDPVAAIKWLDAGYSEAARMYSIYGGLEGEAWEYAEGQTVSGEGKVVKHLSELGENTCWGNQGIVYRVTEDDYLAMDVTDIAINSALATYRANLAYRPYMIQSPWPAIVWPGGLEEEANQFSEINGLIKTAVSEYYSEVIRGNKDLDADWDAYVKSLNDMGLSRYIELVNLYIANDAQNG